MLTKCNNKIKKLKFEYFNVDIGYIRTMEA